MSHALQWCQKDGTYLSEVPFKVSKRLRPVAAPRWVEGRPKMNAKGNFTSYEYVFVKEKELLGHSSCCKVASNGDDKRVADQSPSERRPDTLAVVQHSTMVANNCTVLLPVVAATSVPQAPSAKLPDTPVVNLEEFELLDCTPFHRLELTTLNEMDELKRMLSTSVHLANGNLKNPTDQRGSS